MAFQGIEKLYVYFSLFQAGFRLPCPSHPMIGRESHFVNRYILEILPRHIYNWSISQVQSHQASTLIREIQD